MSEAPVALVTGAAQGIGLGIATGLARAHHRVALLDIDAQAAADAAERLTADGLVARVVRLDVASALEWHAAVATILEQWQRIDVLVNNAGVSPRGTPESTDEAVWDQTLAVNLKGPWLGIKACLPALRASRGTIINVGSTRATRPRRGLFAYGVSKAGLLGLTQQVAIELIDDGVTCNMVAPGWVDTPGERLIQARHGRSDWPQGVRNLTTPEEIAAAVLYLASPGGRRVNGEILYVDSGLHLADDVAMIYGQPDDSRTYRG
ncbi:MAG: short-chain dehydrogenase [Isosphaeraceae bacterium]|nr:MAG: short-chain dehydrogenase [Isosphaeraceae bacterium]